MVGRGIDLDLIVEHRFIFAMLDTHLFGVLGAIIADMNTSLAHMKLLTNWTTLKILKDHTVVSGVFVFDIKLGLDGLVHRLSQRLLRELID